MARPQISATLQMMTKDVTPPPPPGTQLTARLALKPTSGTMPLATVADSSSSTPATSDSGVVTAPITSRVYDFGDATPTVTKTDASTVPHSYAASGAYKARVTLTDTDGATDFAEVPVDVQVVINPPSNNGIQSTTVDGAGFANGCIIFDRRTGGGRAGHDANALLFGDVYGFAHSADNGDTWSMVNGNAIGRPQLHAIGGIAHPTVKNLCYIYWGSPGAGGVMRSTNGGKSYTPMTSTGEQGKLGAEIAGSEQPRQTGRMIWVDPAGDGGSAQRVFCGTQDGVYLSTDNGKTFARWAMAGCYVTGGEVDPNHTDRCYVVADDHKVGSGLYDLTGINAGNNAGGTGKVSPPGGSFNDAQDVCAEPWLGSSTVTRVYIAAGTGARGGIWDYAPATGAFRDLSPSAIMPADTRCSCVDAVQFDATNMMIWTALGSKSGRQPASNQVGSVSGKGYRNIYRSLTSGSSWDFATRTAQVPYTINNAAGDTWWLGDGNKTWMPDGVYWDASQISIDRAQTSRVMISGRSSPTLTNNATDGTATDASKVRFYPHPSGVGAIAVRAVVANPNKPGDMFVTSNDYGVIHSVGSDGFLSRQPALSVGGGGFAGYYDSNGIGYIGLGPGNPSKYTPGSGDVLSCPTPMSDTAKWSSEGFNGGWDCKGVIAWGTGASRKVLAFFKGASSASHDGLFLRTGAQGAAPASLVQVNDIPTFTVNLALAMVRSPNSGMIYLFHPTAGLYRSATGASGSWTLIDGAGDSANTDGLGSLALASTPTTDTLYVTQNIGGNHDLYRYDGVESGAVNKHNITPTGGNPAVSAPRTICCKPDGSALYLATSLEGARPAEIYKTLNPNLNAPTWTNLTDDAGIYSGQAVLPISMCWTPSWIYVGTLGTGCVMVPA